MDDVIPPTAIGVRLPGSDAQLLTRLARDLRGTQASTVAMALRHLAETIRRGAPVYVDTRFFRSEGAAMRPTTGSMSGTYHLVEITRGGQPDYRFMVTAPEGTVPRIGEVLEYSLGVAEYAEAVAFRVVNVRYQLDDGPDPSSSGPLYVKACYVEAVQVPAERTDTVPGGIRLLDAPPRGEGDRASGGDRSPQSTVQP